MKIAYLSGSDIPSRTANSVHVMQMCQAFVDAGHSVDLYARPGRDPVSSVETYYGVSSAIQLHLVSRLPVPGAGGFLYARRVRAKVLRKPIPDLLYARHLYSLSCMSRIGIPFVYEVHAPPQRIVDRRLERNLLKSLNFQRIVAITTSLKEEYQRLFPFLPEKDILVAPDGANPLSHPDDPNSCSPAVSLPGGRFHVAYAGHLYRGKGMELLQDLARANPDMDFHVVGGNEEDIRAWRSRNLPSNMVFHGYIPHARLVRFLRVFDLLLAPYQQHVYGAGGVTDLARWMSPLKLFEYMAAHRPIVASDLPVLREILETDRNALLCPPEDIECWSAALRALRDDPERRSRLADTALNDFTQNYTWKARAANVLTGLNVPTGKGAS